MEDTVMLYHNASVLRRNSNTTDVDELTQYSANGKLPFESQNFRFQGRNDYPSR